MRRRACWCECTAAGYRCTCATPPSARRTRTTTHRYQTRTTVPRACRGVQYSLPPVRSLRDAGACPLTHTRTPELQSTHNRHRATERRSLPRKQQRCASLVAGNSACTSERIVETANCALAGRPRAGRRTWVCSSPCASSSAARRIMRVYAPATRSTNLKTANTCAPQASCQNIRTPLDYS